MNTNPHLEFELAQFTGTEKLYRLTTRHLLTDGTMYLAEHAKCYWLMIAVASHLIGKIDDHFAVAKLSVVGNGAVLTLGDGNVNVFAKQSIEFTDFPLPEVKLYCCFDGDHWMIMLPREY
ncbi:DUF6876 family protein [Limnohabitans sp. 15K]|uniref:DUF6876 family protein n=1 Tax=Limnohabitans sp. 15K TaxID=1100706 RepID=UPI000C1EFB5A|nr:DUF6876 family protein [Limnohabitans sp. 15K]PIT83099.1 hypothetical protein B9Z40_05360 [Limnohabitans sp. 15K]